MSSGGGGVRLFYRAEEGAVVSGGINADRFSIERKKGASGEGRRFSGGSRVVSAPAMELEGGQRGGRDDNVWPHPIDVGSVRLDWRKEKAGWAFWAERLLRPYCAAGPS
jgi:hypothetical protein